MQEINVQQKFTLHSLCLIKKNPTKSKNKSYQASGLFVSLQDKKGNKSMKIKSVGFWVICACSFFVFDDLVVCTRVKYVSSLSMI